MDHKNSRAPQAARPGELSKISNDPCAQGRSETTLPYQNNMPPKGGQQNPHHHDRGPRRAPEPPEIPRLPRRLRQQEGGR